MVYHVGGATLNKSNPYKTFLNFRNNLLMLYKNLPESELSKVMRVRFWLDGLAALMFTWVYMILRRTVRLREMTECIPQGFLAMVPSILILVLAASLKTVTSALGAADYVHSVMAGAGPGLYHMLPAVRLFNLMSKVKG